MESRSAEAFAHTLQTELEHGTRFAFFLGAGCSHSSGIKTAGPLVQEWLPKLCRTRKGAGADVEAFARDMFADHDPKNPAALYGRVIEALFDKPRKRQQEIDRQTAGKDPAFGYAVLAHLIAHEQWGRQCNVVFTTNFDDLVADSLYLYTRRRPLVVGHEALAGFVHLTDEKPLVVKLHGDSRLNPANTSKETRALKPEVQKVFSDLVRERGLIFMGYGGNDRSVLQALKDLKPEDLHGGVYWVNDHIPENEFGAWLKDRRAVWVKHLDFDEVMIHLRNVLKLQDPSEDRFRRLLDGYHQSLTALAERIGAAAAAPNASLEALALKKAVESSEKPHRTVTDYLLLASAAWKADRQAAIRMLEEGLRTYPDAHLLMGQLASYLSQAALDPDRAEAMYERAIAADPGHANNLGNYANFLTTVRKDPDRAEALYERAIAADPDHANNLGNYANFLTDILNAPDRAEAMYERAIAADSGHANNLGNYATFLTDIRKDQDRAEAMYERAIAANPGHAGHLGNYANFLTDIRKDPDRAEEMYERAIAADPGHANHLGNYARLKLAVGDADSGMELVDKAFALRPEQLPLLLELWFYRLSHGAELGEALREMRERLTRGDRSPGWELSDVVAAARTRGHPFPDLLAAIAEVIADKQPIEVLESFPEWRAQQ